MLFSVKSYYLIRNIYYSLSTIFLYKLLNAIFTPKPTWLIIEPFLIITKSIDIHKVTKKSVWK